MRLARLGAAIVLAATLSGCAGQDGAVPVSAPSVAGSAEPAPPPEINITDFPAPSLAFDVGFGASQCQAGMVWLSVDKNLATERMPAGYRSRDAQALLGTPIATGRTIVSLEATRCASSEYTGGALAFGAVLVLVEPPAGFEALAAVDQDWYEMAKFTPDEALAGRLADVNYTVFRGEVTNSVLSVPNGPSTSQAAVNDEAGLVFSLDAITTVAQRQLSFTKRTWHDTPRGTAMFDYRVTTDVIKGAAECSIRSGSVPHSFSMNTSCTPLLTFLGVVWNDTGWDGRARFVPEIHASP